MVIDALVERFGNDNCIVIAIVIEVILALSYQNHFQFAISNSSSAYPVRTLTCYWLPYVIL